MFTVELLDLTSGTITSLPGFSQTLGKGRPFDLDSSGTVLATGDAALEHRSVSETGTVYVYRLPRSTPEVYFATRVLRAPHLNAALGWLASADFEPAESVVLPGGGPPVVSPPGAIEVLDLGAERLRVSVEGEGPGALVVQRAWLPIWRASVDGEAAPVVVANMHRMAVELEAGSHVVELRVERSSLRWSLVASALALVGLVLVAIRGSRRPDAGH